MRHAIGLGVVSPARGNRRGPGRWQQWPALPLHLLGSHREHDHSRAWACGDAPSLRKGAGRGRGRKRLRNGRTLRPGDRHVVSDWLDEHSTLRPHPDAAPDGQGPGGGRHRETTAGRALRPRHRSVDQDRRNARCARMRTPPRCSRRARSWWSAAIRACGPSARWPVPSSTIPRPGSGMPPGHSRPGDSSIRRPSSLPARSSCSGVSTATYRLSASAELYDPATGTWTPAAPMLAARYQSHGNPPSFGCRAGRRRVGLRCSVATEAELYDPAARTWRRTGSLFAPHAGHTATPLPSGKVLVVGGAWQSTPSSPTRSCSTRSRRPGATPAVLSTQSGSHGHAPALGCGSGGWGERAVSSAELYGIIVSPGAGESRARSQARPSRPKGAAVLGMSGPSCTTSREEP